MNIIFMGSPDFAIPSLNRLHQSTHQIKAVVSGKDKRRSRRGAPTSTPVKARAAKLNLSVIEAEDLQASTFKKQLQACEADLFVVVAFRILPPAILEIPPRGCINLHASLLPKYRGAAPIHWAVMNGESETGCTIFRLDEQVDTGKIISQKKLPIAANETTGDVYDRLKMQGAEALVAAVDAIAEGHSTLQSQDESEATGAPKLFTEDCEINFHHPARHVHNKIRGLSPFPTAWATLDGQKFNMYRSKMGLAVDLGPGELKMQDDELLVGCEDGTVVLECVQPAGKRKMSGKDFMNGYNGNGTLQ